MTISVPSASQVFLGNGVTTVFSYSFIMGSASNAAIYYTDTTGLLTQLTPAQYSLSINAPATGQIWGIGGTVTVTVGGFPIANGTSLSAGRLVPLTQTTSISNQGDFSPEVIETALDILCMQIQQVSSRTGQFRGVWTTGVLYNFGDYVIDGANGAGTGNYYMCITANTSGVWSADLAAGDWVLVIDITPIGSGSVTSVSVVTANGFAGSVANPSTAAAITLSTSVTGILKGNGTGISAAVQGIDYYAPGGADIAVADGGTGLSALTANNVILGNGTSSPLFVAPGTSGNILTSNGSTWTSAASGGVAYNSIAGFLPSGITGNSTTGALTVSAGQAANSLNTVYIAKASTTSWAVSNGNAINGYSGGTTLPNSATIHFFICTGASGIGVFASNSLSPTFPTGYTIATRRIFSLNTNSGGVLYPGAALETDGGSMLFWLTTPLLDLSGVTPATAGTSYTLTVPSGIKVEPKYRSNYYVDPAAGTTTQVCIYLSGDETSIAPTGTATINVNAGITGFNTVPGFDVSGYAQSVSITTLVNNNIKSSNLLTTNSSGQIVIRSSAATGVISFVTQGFKDWRRS